MNPRVIKIGIVIIAFVIFSFSISGCHQGAAKEAQATEVPPVPVMIDNPDIGSITEWHRTTCDLNSPLEAMLSFPNGGKITDLVVKEGDKVIAGQYLGKVDTSAMAANLSAIMSSAEGVQKQAEAADLGASAAESGVAMAQAAYDQAVRDYERYVKLHEDGVATDAEFERMELGMETSRISVEGAKDQVEAAYAQAVAAHAQVQSVRDQAGQIQVMIGDGTLRAPFGGRISIVFYDPGTVVGPGSPVFKLVGEGEDTGNRLEVHIEVPETIIGSVKAGSPIYLDVASCEEEIQTAVDHLGPEVAKKLTVWTNQFSDGFLHEPDKLTLGFAFPMPDNAGRLNVNLTPVVLPKDRRQVLRLDLTARGQLKTKDIPGALSAIDLGHEWVVRGFASLTCPEMHQVWEREQ